MNTRDISNSADIESSSAEYATRFAGPTGAWMLEVQREALLQQLSLVISSQSALADTTSNPISVLDVGGGHAQVVAALQSSSLAERLAITVVGSDPVCAERVKPYLTSSRDRFEACDLTALPFPDKSFDVVTCFRYIPHCPEWQQCISELCRVAKYGVIIDYPTWQSVNLLTPLLYSLKKRSEGNTRRFILFSHREIASAFAANGFQVTNTIGEFVLPMALHRALKKPSLSRLLERPFRVLGLDRLLGSPVVCAAQPAMKR